jgi:glutamine---fructose-6-phosphate transaminase (isomerizing)
MTEVGGEKERYDKDGFETFMLKEIHEQPRAVAETLSHWRAHLASGAEPTLPDDLLRKVRRILILGCGTSYHAGLAGRLAIERWARIPVDVEIASEFRYRDPIVGPNTLALGITQSGETADTLAAMRLAREHGATVVAITNVAGSQATRDSDAVLFTRAGIEIGVCATKTFTAQVVLLYALALRLARISDGLDAKTLAELRQGLELLPNQLDTVLGAVAAHMRQLGEKLAVSPFFLYLGRLSGLPVAMEGALKLKEIAYVPTDAYPAGEMKHGPIALLSAETPVVCVATEERVLPKLLSNLSEVRARGAPVVAVAGETCKEIAEHAEEIIYVPTAEPLLQAVLAAVPLQLLAYHVARTCGLNVDQPRNLAKTVTVE